MSLAELEEIATKWDGDLEGAIRRLADSHRFHLFLSRNCSPMDRAALATVLIAAITVAFPARKR